MIVNFDDDPRNSLIYTSSLILYYLKNNNNKVKLDEACRYWLDTRMEYALFFITVDWMYLVGLIEEINDRNELVLCN